MNFDLATMIESKRALRRRLAERPIAEKLALLDKLRERTVSIRGERLASNAMLREQESPYRTKGAK